MPKKTALGVAILLLVFVGHGFAESKGDGSITLQESQYGNVPFSHLLHQNKLRNCEYCHKLYLKKTGAIEAGIRAGALTSKEVMANCKDCHTKIATAGFKSGPTICNGCHKG